MINLNFNIPDKILNKELGEIIPHTYKDGRSCRYCNSPIPDHINKQREFCEKRVFLNGKTLDCKSLYWTPKRRKESKIEKKQQEICTSFRELVEFEKNEMTLEELCIKGFSLYLSKQSYVLNEKEMMVIFEGGHLIIDRKTYNIKIVKS
jgi:hypothetical protein